MKKLVLALTSVLAFSGTALAADMAVKAPVYKAPPPVAIYNWSGFYIGLNGGGGSSHKCWDLVQNFTVSYNPNLPEGCMTHWRHLRRPDRLSLADDELGVRPRSPRQLGGFKGNNVNSLAGTLFAAGLTDELKIQSFGLFTGQVGYAWNNVLWYAKGGAAVVADRYRTFINTTNVQIDSGSETRWGGTIGTGVEIGFAPHWSVAFEYDHLFMGSQNVNSYLATTGAFSATDRASARMSI